MSMSQFAPPASPATGIQWADYQNALLILSVKGLEASVSTAYGEATDVPRCNVAVLDGAKAGEQLDAVLVFPKVLASQLRDRVGQMVLGRLTTGVAKSGQSAPWMLQAATEAESKVAEQWLAQRNAPVAPTPAPQPAAAGNDVPF